MAIKYVHATERTRKLQNGVWHCEQCKSTFHGGGPAIHRRHCSDNTSEYDNLTYRFSTYEVAVAKRQARIHSNDDALCPLAPVSVAILKAAGYEQLINDTPEAE